MSRVTNLFRSGAVYAWRRQLPSNRDKKSIQLSLRSLHISEAKIIAYEAMDADEDGGNSIDPGLGS